jgi:hypothetical protein
MAKDRPRRQQISLRYINAPLLWQGVVHLVDLVHQVRGWFSGVELKMSRRQGAEEEGYLNRYVTDEQRSRRLIFSSTPWAVQNRRFWRVARSTRMIHIRALRSRLPKSPILRRRR